MDELEKEHYPVKTAYRLIVTAELTPDEEEGGYSVYCPELDIYTQGETVEDAVANLREAAEGYIKVVGLDELDLHPNQFPSTPAVSSRSERFRGYCARRVRVASG
jgi:predicted RNase H-like HicB family nuclease